MLGWVILLKTEIEEEKKEVKKLEDMLERRVKDIEKDAEVGDEKHSWGKKPKWMK